MKNMIMATVMMLTSTLSYAAKIESKEISRLCRGEFTESIIESVKSCSAQDLAQAQVEIYKIEAEVDNVKKQLEAAEAYIASPAYQKDKRKDLTLTATVIGGGILGLAITGVGIKIGNDKITNTGLMISLLMSIGLGYGSEKIGYDPVKFRPEQIPSMKAAVSSLLEQVKIRKALLDAANAIKSAQAAQ